MSGAEDLFKKAFTMGIVDKAKEKREKEKAEMAALAASKPKPVVAPVADDEASKRASQREMQRRFATRGRASTMLSNNSNLG